MIRTRDTILMVHPKSNKTKKLKPTQMKKSDESNWVIDKI